jgi:hypothetical protein
MSIAHSHHHARHVEASTAFSRGAWTYFAITLGWTFTFWGVAAVAGVSSASLPGLLLLFLGGLGPALAAILGQFLNPAQNFGAYRLAWSVLAALMVIAVSGKDLGKDQ